MGVFWSKSQWAYFVRVLTGIFGQSLNGHFWSKSQWAYFVKVSMGILVKVSMGISQNLNRFTPSVFLAFLSIFAWKLVEIGLKKV
jgi:hypothetical protein